MNDQDRERVARLMVIMDDVPRPQLSMSAEAIGGLIGYSKDMAQVAWVVRKVCEGMCLEGRDGLEVEYDYLHPDKVIAAFDAWLENRRKAQWARGGPEIESFYEYPPDGS